jgi:hypothetical protein
MAPHKLTTKFTKYTEFIIENRAAKPNHQANWFTAKTLRTPSYDFVGAAQSGARRRWSNRTTENRSIDKIAADSPLLNCSAFNNHKSVKPLPNKSSRGKIGNRVLRLSGRI